MDFILALLPHAIAVSISPLGIAAAVILLLTKRPRRNSIGFSLGWFFGIFISVYFFTYLSLFEHHLIPHDSLFPKVANGILAIALLLLAYYEFRRRPKKGVPRKTPGWLKKMNRFSGLESLGIGIFLAIVNAKNTVIDMAVGIFLGSQKIGLIERINIIILFALIGSGIIISITLLSFLLGRRLEKNLKFLKNWFITHNNSLLFIIFLVMGVLFITKAFN